MQSVRIGFVTIVTATALAACSTAPTGRDRLIAAAAAIDSLSSVVYTYTYGGSGGAAGAYVGTARLIRGPGASLYWADLSPSPSWDPVGAGAERRGRPPTLTISGGSDHVAARDEALGRFSYGTISGGSGHLVASAPFAVLFELLETDPFAAELVGEPTLEGQEMVGGVLCDVVHATSSEFGPADVWWYIGVEDNLPRGYRWVAGRDAPPGELFLEIDLVDANAGLTLESLSISQHPRDDVVDEDARRVEPGVAAPDWTLARTDGGSVALADLRGSVVVLGFWSSWCAPCRALMTEYGRISAQYAADGVTFLALNMWEDPGIDPEQAARDRGFEAPVLIRAERVATDYRLTAPPALFVIDAGGDLVHVANPVIGDPAAVAGELEAVIRSQLGR